MAEEITLLSWNVNGIRAVHKKGFLDWLAQAAPDILCLQETRADEASLPDEIARPLDYHTVWNASIKKRGYSGTALLTRPKPLEVRLGLGVDKFDDEGRTIIARYPAFTLINCYFPNGSRDHSRVPFKLDFYDAFLDRCERLRAQGQPVIFCGDVNTAHKEIDLAHPRENRNTTGFLPEERAWLDRVTRSGYVDTFRRLHPNLAGQYTWWSMPSKARERNVGWRIDYFFVGSELVDRVTDAFILSDVTGSDHCPVGLRLRLQER
jgi:exodeoxyribonuclease-3